MRILSWKSEAHPVQCTTLCLRWVCLTTPLPATFRNATLCKSADPSRKYLKTEFWSSAPLQISVQNTLYSAMRLVLPFLQQPVSNSVAELLLFNDCGAWHMWELLQSREMSAQLGRLRIICRDRQAWRMKDAWELCNWYGRAFPWHRRGRWWIEDVQFGNGSKISTVGGKVQPASMGFLEPGYSGTQMSQQLQQLLQDTFEKKLRYLLQGKRIPETWRRKIGKSPWPGKYASKEAKIHNRAELDHLMYERGRRYVG